MKEISVVLTTYMHGRYIRAAIESVLNQNFEDYELIIVDDESPDNTEEEVSKIKDERILYVRQNHNGLPANTRNRGISLATGKLIAFLDGDDIWGPDKLKRCLEIFKGDSTIDILSHDLDLMRTDENKIFKRTFFGPYQKDMYAHLLFKGNALAISSTVMKRSIFSEDKYSFSEDARLFTVEDYDLWLRLASSRCYHFFYCPDTLGIHRVFEGSASLTNIEKNALNMLYLLNKNAEEFSANSEKNLKACIKKRNAQVMFGAALAFNYHSKFQESLKWHLRAIKEYPIYWKPYLMSFPSLLKIRLGYV